MLNNNNSGMVMPVGPVYGGGYGGNYGGSGFFGGDGAWLILFILAMMGGGWGFGGGYGGMMWPMMMGGMGGWGMDYLYPWLNNSQHISDGFRDQQLQTSIGTLQNTVTSGFGDVQLGLAGINQNICQTGNSITGAVRDGFSASEIAANGRQMANMQQGFGIQSAIERSAATGAAATADLKYTVAQEGCADRNALSGALNTLLAHIDQKVQGVQDKLCQLELDGVKQNYENRILGLQNALDNSRSEAQSLRFEKSQTAQTAAFNAGLARETDAIYNRFATCPVNTVPVAGSTPLFSCNPSFNGSNCGCPGNGFGFAAA